MVVALLLRKIEQLEHRVNEVEAENVALKIENTHLKETLKQYADGKSSKPPKFGLNYSSQRNEQFVWRLIDHKAQYVHYKIYDLPDSQTLPTVPGVRNAASEYGIEFLLMIAHHVYWVGLSIDKALTLMEFHTEIKISKSQADSLLYQLANDWASEYKAIAERIALASILYVDETAWKLGKQACYTWVFGTVADVYYRCGVGRGKGYNDFLRFCFPVFYFCKKYFPHT